MIYPGMWTVFIWSTSESEREVAQMRLNDTNRRRALQRRRKLMPEPRRVHAPQERTLEPKILQEAPAGSIRNRAAFPTAPVDQPESEPTIAHS